ncbi:conjugal transfer protein [Streptomyces aureoversilis]|uniref:Conjugal transfer protein n=1 Tax=Streptomyces aureoversilis TaxID=67277 RepID=A0ABW0A9J6_9ACTN
MKRLRRGKKKGDTWGEESAAAAAEQEAPAGQQGELADDGEDRTGWQTSTAGLSGMTRLARIGAWVLVASGPLMGIAALAASSGPAQGAPKKTAAVRQASGTGPSGFATLYVTAFLEAGEGTERSLAPYFSGAVNLTVPPGTRSVTRSAVLGARETAPGYWSVTIAATVTVKDKKGTAGPAAVQYYRVGVQALGPENAGGTSSSGDALVGYTATSLPAQVAAPEALKPGALGYGTSRGSSTSDPATETASGFLGAYLAGSGDLSRYTSPGVRLQPVAPAPYTAVKVTHVDDDSPSAGDQKVPGDGAKRHLLVSIAATDKDGRAWPLTYALDLSSRAGRWEVAALADAPVLKPDSQPSAAPATATAAPDSDGASTPTATPTAASPAASALPSPSSS